MMWSKAVTMTEIVKAEVRDKAEAGENVQGVVEINHFANQVTMYIPSLCHRSIKIMELTTIGT